MTSKIRIFVLLLFQHRKLRVEARGYVKTRVYFVRGDTDQSGMNYFIENMISSYSTHTGSFFTPEFLVNHPVYAITVNFIYLLSDKPYNADFFQIFLCELYHT